MKVHSLQVRREVRGPRHGVVALSLFGPIPGLTPPPQEWSSLDPRLVKGREGVCGRLIPVEVEAAENPTRHRDNEKNKIIDFYFLLKVISKETLHLYQE